MCCTFVVMKREHVVDKFGNSLFRRMRRLYGGGTAVLDGGDEKHVNVGNKKLRFVSDPEFEHDGVTKGYLERFYVSKLELEERLDKLFSKQKGGEKEGDAMISGRLGTTLSDQGGETVFDAAHMRIINVKAAQDLDDAVSLRQACTFDANVMNFKCGGTYFDLVQDSSNKPILCARQDYFGNVMFCEYKSEKEVMPSKLLRWNERLQLQYDESGREVVWDEETKRFAYREATAWGPSRPHPLVGVIEQR